MNSSYYYEGSGIALRVWQGRDLAFDWHIQGQLELCYLLDGHCTVRLEKESYALSAGEAIVILPYLRHAYTPSEPYRYAMFIMDTGFLPEYAALLSECACRSPFIPAGRLHPKVPQFLLDLCREPDMSPVLQRFYAGALMGHLLECLPLERGERRASGGETMCALLDYISAHIAEPLTLDSLSKALYLNKFTISKVLSEHVGCNLRAYLNALRVSMARNLMADPKLSTSDIIMKCGFESERTFYRAFQTHLDVSPGELRRQMQMERDVPLNGVYIGVRQDRQMS